MVKKTTGESISTVSTSEVSSGKPEKKIVRYPRFIKNLPTMDIDVNFYSSLVVNKKQKIMKLLKKNDNSQWEKERPDSSYKS
jgi:hypothetical protein